MTELTPKTVASWCNPARCRWWAECVLPPRRATLSEAAGGGADSAGIPAAKDNAIQKTSEPVKPVYVPADSQGLGCFHLNGFLDAAPLPALTALMEDAQNLVGLLLVVNSTGGKATVGDMVRKTLDFVRQKGVPSVSYVRGAGSAAAEIAIRCADRVLLAPEEGEIGGFGAMIHCCHLGHGPVLHVSPAACRKTERGILAPFHFVANPITSDLWRRHHWWVDHDHRRQIAAITTARNLSGCPAQWADGRMLGGVDAMAGGLVDAVAPREAAAEILLDLAKKRLNHNGLPRPIPQL